MLPVRMEYESDTIPSLEVGVLPPAQLKGKNRACSISPIIISDDEIPVVVVKK